jgi:hypothetical protein
MADDAARPDAVERRKNQRLRELVDEMLASIREGASRELWTEAERAQYEAELEGIMARVRRQATASARGTDAAEEQRDETPPTPPRRAG